MTEQEHYSLRWNNHQNHILRAFDALLQTKTLVDVTLVCAETSIRAHKVVLSACSPFFQRVFSETPCKHPVIVLKDFRGWVVQAIVDFMYRGEISVPQERLQILIQAGESLQVRGLVDHPISENTLLSSPTPAASPNDFMDSTTIIATSSPIPSPHPSNYDDELPSKITINTNLEHPDTCTSPMPRRKQARPRRRSGECGPHDLLPTRKGRRRGAVTAQDGEQSNDDGGAEDDDEEDDDDEGGDSKNKKKIKLISETNRPESRMSSDKIENDDNNEPIDSCDEGVADEEDHVDEDIDEDNEAIDDDNNAEVPENLCTKNNSLNNNSENQNNNNSKNNNNNNSNSNRIVLSLKDIRHLNRPSAMCRPPHQSGSGQQAQQTNHSGATEFSHPTNANQNFIHSENMKRESIESRLENESPFMDQMDLTLAAAAAAAHQHHQNMQHQLQQQQQQQNSASRQQHEILENIMHKEFGGGGGGGGGTPSSPMSLPSHFNPRDPPPHPPSPLPFPGMSSALTLTPPHHMFGLDSPLGLFPPGMDPAKLYNPLMEMSDPRSGMHPGDHHHHHGGPFLKKKISRAKGQHSAPRGGPPRSWTNAELTEALQHVWNKKMTTSQASRIFGIPYNSLLMYVRGKYGKSLKLEQLRKDCISGPPIELLTMGLNAHNNNTKGLNENHRNKELLKDLEGGGGGSMQRSSSSEPDLLSSPNAMFNPFPPGFYPDFAGGFPGLPLSMLNLLPPSDRHQAAAMHHMVAAAMDEDCKSDRSKQSIDDDFGGGGGGGSAAQQPLALSNRDERREIMQQNGQD